MKKLFLGICILFNSHLVKAQLIISGTISDKASGENLASATVQLLQKEKVVRTALSNENGRFSLHAPAKGLYVLRISYSGFVALEQSLELSENMTSLIFTLTKSNLFLDPIEITAIRAAERAPFTKTELNKQEIENVNTGQDLPFLLQQTPSVVVNSDAGNGIGYTGIRIRGTDATRINVTLNGIPYNDAESLGTFFVDLPDFASSVNSIQVQRGVGTSSNGAGAFGATINLATNTFDAKPYLELNNSYGSFNSWKNTLKFGTGLLGDHFTLDGRLSGITSDGFVDRARSRLRSFYSSAAYINKKSSLRLNIFSGKEKTYQAWNGIPEAKLKNDLSALTQHYWNNYGYLYLTEEDSLNLFNSNPRTYNYFTYANQTDNYWQTHYQLFWNQQVNKTLSFNAAFFLTRGKGYYEEYKVGEDLADYNLPSAYSDLVRRLWLDNYFYGTVYSIQYKKKKHQFIAGGGYTRYDGNHYGEIIQSEVTVPKNYRWYDLDALKTDFNLYGKYTYRFHSNWELFTDLQYRHVLYNINGFRKNPSLLIHNNYNFFNPKLGISYNDTRGWNYYLSASMGNKEPNRDDFETGLTQKPKHEALFDLETGVGKKSRTYDWSATAYYMYYKDQLVLTGKINDVGAYTRTNIPKSYRAGIELHGGWKPVNWLEASADLTFSRNKVLDFMEYQDDYDNGGQKAFFYSSPSIALSPDWIGSSMLQFLPVRHGTIRFLSKFVSRQYLDNTENTNRSIDPYFVSDLQLQYNWSKNWLKHVSLFFHINNVFDTKYEANGYTYSYIYGGNTITENFLYPMAGINFMGGINLKL